MSNSSGSEESSLNVNLLLSTFLKIEPQAEDFATSFYQILFEKYPQTQHLFSSTNMEQQKIKLIQSLQLVIANVHNTEALNNILKALGARHVEYGAVLTDYPLIGDALLQALEKHLQWDWNEEVKQTWTAAYQMIAEMMTVGAQEFTDARGIHDNNELGLNKAEFKSKATVGHTTISRPDSIFTKLIPWAIFGMVAICGYLLWALMNNRPDVSPTLIEPSPYLENPTSSPLPTK